VISRTPIEPIKGLLLWELCKQSNTNNLDAD